jgi:chemotaxis signal transduction protein
MTAHLLARVGEERFAFRLDRVVEALDAPALHDPPWRPEGMLGTMRHRGLTLPVWDGGSAFGIPRDGDAGTALVLDDAGRHLALLVDDALDIMRFDRGAVRALPSAADGEGLLSGVVQDAEGLVSVVRVDVLVSRLESRGARRAE